jgi:hypothetical protein
LKHEFPTEWYKFLNPAATAISQSMQICVGPERFPFQFRQRKFQFSQVELFLLFKTPQFQQAYVGGAQLVLYLGPASSTNPSSARLASNVSILGGLAYGSISQPQQPTGSPLTWVLTTNNTDIQKISTSLQNVVNSGGTNYCHLNPAAIDDILILCHYSVSS